MFLPGVWLLLKILSFTLASWLLVHVFAVFGFFAALAYPAWWFLAPKAIPCLMCQVTKEGENCRFCGRPASKEKIPPPQSFRSALANSLLILFLSLLSLGFVCVEAQILFRLGFPPTAKTVSFIIPPKGQYRLSELFPMKIEITGIKTPINAIQADVSFDPRILEVAEISTKDSFANIFIQKEINNEAGYARLTGGLPNPGFFADHGIFGTVFFKGKRPGVVKVEFLPSSMVLANDGKGTNVLRDLASATYLVLPEEMTAEEQAQQTILLQPQVLGEEVEETQMKFYDEEAGRVLGLQTGKEIEKEKKFHLPKLLANLLETVDRWILNFWHAILSWFNFSSLINSLFGSPLVTPLPSN